VTADCRLYLLTPAITDADAFAPQLVAALGAGDVAAVLLRLQAGDECTQAGRIRRLAPIAQDAGAALIVAVSPKAARRGGADGVHLTGGDSAAIAEAIAAMQPPQRIVGAGGLNTKHDAMVAGEAGVDYVMFGEPRADGSVPDLAFVQDRATWWAEIFAVPCVAFAATLGEVGALAATGAEFVALGDGVWTHPQGPSEAVRRALAIVAAVDAPAP